MKGASNTIGTLLLKSLQCNTLKIIFNIYIFAFSWIRWRKRIFWSMENLQAIGVQS